MAENTYRPNAAGDECNIDAENGCSACPNHYDCVDEAVADDDTTRVATNSATYQRDLYGIPIQSGAGTINKVTVYASIVRWIASDQDWAKICCKTHETAYESAEIDTVGDTAYEEFSKEWATNPNTSAAWTWPEVAALQIGISLRSCESGVQRWVACTQVYVVVDYTPPALVGAVWDFFTWG